MVKIRRKKGSSNATHEPNENQLKGQKRNWAEERGVIDDGEVKRSFRNLLIVAAGILILLVVIAVASFAGTSGGGGKFITASDTFAVSSAEQTEMKQSAEYFVTGTLLSAYCSDREQANTGKELALAQMAIDTSSYKNVSGFSVGDGEIAFDNLALDIGEAKILDGTQAYAGDYTYEITGKAIDKADGENGAYADNGYKYVLKFSSAQADDGTEESKWVISEATISKM